jgi:hypothetical protein
VWQRSRWVAPAAISIALIDRGSSALIVTIVIDGTSN